MTEEPKQTRHDIDEGLRTLIAKGLVREVSPGEYEITEDGRTVFETAQRNKL